MVKVFNAWGTAAAFQIFLKRYRVVQKLRTGCLRQMQFLSGFFRSSEKTCIAVYLILPLDKSHFITEV